MIVHNTFRRPRMIRVVNSRLPVYEITYGDGLGDVVRGLFTRIAPKAMPIAKQLSMKAIDVIPEKAPSAIGDLAGKAFSFVKDRILRLLRRKQQVKLPSTQVMPANESKIINQAATQRVMDLADASLKEKQDNITASLNAGSGLRR